jgi:hypothetical protein
MPDNSTTPHRIGDDSRPVEQSVAVHPDVRAREQSEWVQLRRDMFLTLRTEHVQLEKLVTLYWEIVRPAETTRNHRHQLGDAWGDEDKIFPELERLADAMQQSLALSRTGQIESVEVAFDEVVAAREGLGSSLGEAQRLQRREPGDRRAALADAVAKVEDGLQTLLSSFMALQGVCRDEALALLGTIRSDLGRIQGGIEMQDTRPETPIAQGNDAPSPALVSEGERIQEPGSFGDAGDATTKAAVEPTKDQGSVVR